MRSMAPNLLLLIAFSWITVARGEGAGAKPAEPEPGGAVLARVNGEEITQEHLNIELNSFLSLGEEGRGTALPSVDETLRRLIQNRLLEQEGYRIGSQEAPAVKNQVKEYLRVQAVVALLDSISEGVAHLGEAKLDSMMNVGRSMRRYSHILVQDERLARALKDSLAAGLPFADLARRHSTDGTAAKGGDLGWAAQGAYVDEFETAADRLALGETTGPVKTQFGWHLITLTEQRDETFGQSEEMREAMRQALVKENRMSAARSFVASLKEKYQVKIDEALLASLDFGSKDPAVQDSLRNSEAVLAELPKSRLTVKGLSRNILYTYFHGLSGKPEAAAIRDKVFREWVDEALLSHEARALGFDRRPELSFQAEQLERRLIRDEVLKTVLGSAFKPEEAELRSYYDAHRAEFADPPRVKVKSIALGSESAGLRFRSMLEAGAQFDWLSTRDPGVLAGGPPLPGAWIDASELGLAAGSLEKGTLVGPRERDGIWIMAEVSAVEAGQPRAFAECRSQVEERMARERHRELLDAAFKRLEEAARIEVLPEAREHVAASLKHYAELVAQRAGSAAGQAKRDAP